MIQVNLPTKPVCHMYARDSHHMSELFHLSMIGDFLAIFKNRGEFHYPFQFLAHFGPFCYFYPNQLRVHMVFKTLYPSYEGMPFPLTVSNICVK